MFQTTCVRGRTVAAALLILAFSACAVAAFQDSVVYTEARTSASTYRDRGPSYAPTYIIYPDRPRSPDEARALIDELGMLKHIDEYKARALVVGPANGSTYDQAKDLEAFKDVLRSRRSSNLKISDPRRRFRRRS